MVSLTFYGGVNEIGGNKILVEDKKTRIFLDFGQSFSLLDEFFVDWLQPRGRFGLRDYFALGLMPKLKGLYSEEALKDTNLEYSEPEYDAVFISHAHFDHTAHLRYLDPRIPVYMGECAKSILNSTQETTGAYFFSEEQEERKDGSVRESNKLETFRTGKELKVGDIAITPVHVDHSVPGAYGFMVETSEGSIVYTGDLRKHGNKPTLTKEFVESAGKSEPEALIIEGTRVAPKENRKNHTEQFVREESMKIAESSGKLILAMRYPKDLDRFRSFYEIAKKTGKKLAIGLKTAHLLKSLGKDEKLVLPDPERDENIIIYARKMKVYKGWEKPFLSNSRDWEWIKENQKDLIWELEFSQLTELIDVKPDRGVCIHSMSEPFEEDPSSQLQDEVMRNWLDRFGLEHHQLHASGHAGMEEIFGIGNEIGPRRTIPIHTQHEELFKGNVTHAKKGSKIEI